jgi:serine/threonine protein kinase
MYLIIRYSDRADRQLTLALLREMLSSESAMIEYQRKRALAKRQRFLSRCLLSPSNPVSGQTSPHNQVGAYLVDSPLGGGAAAMVYRAHRIGDTPQKIQIPPDAADSDGADADSVALKVLRPEATRDPHTLACFQFEARVVSRLDHPGIMRVYDTGVDEGRMYTAMELIDGPSFDHFLLAQKRLPETQAVEIARQICRALDYLHAQGYVHRDIKPANLMLTREGIIKVTDFGTAIRIEDGAAYEVGLYGTPSFLAPEQISVGSRIDGRSDLYAVGMILYLMVTGRKPFYGSRDEVLQANREKEPPAPSKFAHVSPELESIILKALAKDPDARYQSGAEFAEALDDVTLISEPESASLVARLFGWICPGA